MFKIKLNTFIYVKFGHQRKKIIIHGLKSVKIKN